jgi:hypothetical protein
MSEVADMTFDIERELAKAMSAEVETLPRPRIDMARIRRRARSRRFVLPAIILTAGATAVAPMATSSPSEPLGSRPVGDVAGPVHAAATSPHPAPVATTPPPPAGASGEPADAVSVPTATASATCWTATRAITAGERAGVVQQVRTAVGTAEAALNRRLGGLAEVTVPHTGRQLDLLVPAVGTLVEHVGCGDDGQVSAAAVQDMVGDATSVVSALAGVLRDTLGKLHVSGVRAVVTISSGGDDGLTVRIAVDGGRVVSGTITAVVRPGTSQVTDIDTSRLMVFGVPVPGLPEVSDVSELPGLPELPVGPTPTDVPLPELPDVPELPGLG